MPVSQQAREEVKRRLLEDTPYWAENFAYIVNKQAEKVKLDGNLGQLALDQALEEQRAAGKPMRAIILKARQIGFSTWAQAKLIHRATQRPNYHTVVVAHDRDTGGKLYRIGQTIYGALPDDDELGLKPDIASHRRSRFMHFADSAKEAWMHGDQWPDSTYLVDTAGEFEAGRGGTYRALHLSEVAFWENIQAKLTSLLSAVPDDPETLVLLESTANGFNEFKDWWDAAEAGRSDFIAFFWPWWKEPAYSQRFLNESERAVFHVGEEPWGKEEAMLLKPGPPDPQTGEPTPLTLEQLNWRRSKINNQFNGDLRFFNQEFPSTADEAFLSTGRRVFAPDLVKKVINQTAKTDPRIPSTQTPGPALGTFAARKYLTRQARSGTIEVPEDPVWLPRGADTHGPSPWKLWVPPDEAGKPQDATNWDPRGSRPLWVAVEITGSWGLPIARALKFDYHYPFVYQARRKDSQSEKQESRLGWQTSMKTKPIIEAHMMNLLREGSHGIKSRLLADEMNTYVRDEKGKTGAEAKRYDDALMAYMIGQQIVREMPLKDGIHYVISVDVSGGKLDEGSTEPDWHVIEVIDHREKTQVAEYRSRIDPDLLAEQVYLAALYFGGSKANKSTGAMRAKQVESVWPS